MWIKISTVCARSTVRICQEILNLILNADLIGVKAFVAQVRNVAPGPFVFHTCQLMCIYDLFQVGIVIHRPELAININSSYRSTT